MKTTIPAIFSLTTRFSRRISRPLRTCRQTRFFQTMMQRESELTWLERSTSSPGEKTERRAPTCSPFCFAVNWGDTARLQPGSHVLARGRCRRPRASTWKSRRFERAARTIAGASTPDCPITRSAPIAGPPLFPERRTSLLRRANRHQGVSRARNAMSSC